VQQFPNAAVVMMRKEFEFWMSAETQARLEAGEIYGLGALEAVMASSVRDHLAPARDRLRLLDGQRKSRRAYWCFPRRATHPGMPPCWFLQEGSNCSTWATHWFIRRSSNIRIGSAPSICLPWKRCARESSCWIGCGRSCLFAGYHLPAGWARSNLGRHRIVGAGCCRDMNA